VSTPRIVPVLAALGGALLLALTGCSSAQATDPAAEGKPSVVAAFYPLQYVAESVGGDTVSVTSLTPSGVEPHDLELSAAQVAEIAQADVVLYVKGFQPAVDEAIAQQAPDRAIDVSAGLPLLGADPHVWLDPANMATIGTTVGERLAEIEPDAATTVAANSEKLSEAMTNLDSQFTTGLATCRSRELVVSHEAFGYLARRYGLDQVGITGLTPEADPSPKQLAAVADFVEQHGVTTIYFETLTSPAVAKTLASETGATTAVLDPIEGLTDRSKGNDYLEVMRSNLATLRAGQDCS